MAEQIEKYQLCVSGDTENLMTRVRVLIARGWVPVGGVASFKDKIIQAMVLPLPPGEVFTEKQKQEAASLAKEQREKYGI